MLALGDDQPSLNCYDFKSPAPFSVNNSLFRFCSPQRVLALKYPSAVLTHQTMWYMGAHLVAR